MDQDTMMRLAHDSGLTRFEWVLYTVEDEGGHTDASTPYDCLMRFAEAIEELKNQG
jgi:hypothetical protein